MGFSFDHTTGIPYIPAASVKGLLRSVFPQKLGKKNNKFSEQHHQYLSTYLTIIGVDDLSKKLAKINQNLGINILESKVDFIDLLEMEIFEGLYPDKKRDSSKQNNHADWEWRPYSIYKRDVFHDAYPIASFNNKGRFLGSDFITPHSNPLKNPKPIQFMKILPAVDISFQFALKGGLISAEQKLALFEHLLTDLGIGAKTNVGYGQFEKVEVIIYELNQELKVKVVGFDESNNKIIVKVKGQEKDFEVGGGKKGKILKKTAIGDVLTAYARTPNANGSLNNISLNPPK